MNTIYVAEQLPHLIHLCLRLHQSSVAGEVWGWSRRTPFTLWGPRASWSTCIWSWPADDDEQDDQKIGEITAWTGTLIYYVFVFLLCFMSTSSDWCDSRTYSREVILKTKCNWCVCNKVDRKSPKKYFSSVLGFKWVWIWMGTTDAAFFKDRFINRNMTHQVLASIHIINISESWEKKNPPIQY